VKNIGNINLCTNEETLKKIVIYSTLQSSEDITLKSFWKGMACTIVPCTGIYHLLLYTCVQLWLLQKCPKMAI